MNDDQSVELALKSGLWHIAKMEELIIRYKACRTKQDKVKLIPLAQELKDKSGFELKELEKLMDEMEEGDNQGDEWKQ